MAAHRVENGPLGLGERFQALGEVGFGERNEGTTYWGIVWSLGELNLYFGNRWDATHESCVWYDGLPLGMSMRGYVFESLYVTVEI